MKIILLSLFVLIFVFLFFLIFFQKKDLTFEHVTRYEGEYSGIRVIVLQKKKHPILDKEITQTRTIFLSKKLAEDLKGISVDQSNLSDLSYVFYVEYDEKVQKLKITISPSYDLKVDVISKTTNLKNTDDIDSLFMVTSREFCYQLMC